MGSCLKLGSHYLTGEQIVGDPSIRLLIGVDGGGGPCGSFDRTMRGEIGRRSPGNYSAKATDSGLDASMINRYHVHLSLASRSRSPEQLNPYSIAVPSPSPLFSTSVAKTYWFFVCVSRTEVYVSTAQWLGLEIQNWGWALVGA